ncbi:unnamed protein product [Linum tenue]|nr:unnamed protein product [Linum tenue]
MVTMMRSVTSSSSLLVLSLSFFFFFFFVLGFLFEFVFDDSEILLCVLESWVLLRYQSVSPDCLPLPNGKKPTSTVGTSGRSIPVGVSSSPTGYEIKGFRYRSPSRTQDFHHHSSSSNGVAAGSPSLSDKREASPPSRGGSGDMLLQWGQKKRARVSRSEIRALADESSSSGQARQQTVASKVTRRLDDSKLPAPSMPPPPPAAAQHPQQTTNGRGGNLRKETAALLSHR